MRILRFGHPHVLRVSRWLIACLVWLWPWVCRHAQILVRFLCFPVIGLSSPGSPIIDRQAHEAHSHIQFMRFGSGFSECGCCQQIVAKSADLKAWWWQNRMMAGQAPHIFPCVNIGQKRAHIHWHGHMWLVHMRRDTCGRCLWRFCRIYAAAELLLRSYVIQISAFFYILIDHCHAIDEWTEQWTARSSGNRTSSGNVDNGIMFAFMDLILNSFSAALMRACESSDLTISGGPIARDLISINALQRSAVISRIIVDRGIRLSRQLPTHWRCATNSAYRI